MKLHQLLCSPVKVFLCCLLFLAGSIVFNGSLINLYSLHRDQTELTSQILGLHASLTKLDVQMKRAKDPAFIERQALDQLDMASDHDLVFVFSE